MKSLHSILSSVFCGFIFVMGLNACIEKSDSPGKEYDLKMNFPEGSKYLYTITKNQDITSMGIANIQQEMTLELKYEMLPGPDDQQKLQITFQRIFISNNGLAGNINFDSKHPDSTSLFKGFNKIINKPFYAQFDQKGRFTKIIQAKNEDVQNKETETIKSLASDSAIFPLLLKSNFVIYPNKPVRIGETWQNKSEINVASFTLDTKSDYTLQSVQNDIATISMKSKLELPESTMTQDGYKIKMQLNGNQSGSYKMNIYSGEIISQRTTQEIKAKINSLGQELPMIIHSQITGKSTKI